MGLLGKAENYLSSEKRSKVKIINGIKRKLSAVMLASMLLAGSQTLTTCAAGSILNFDKFELMKGNVTDKCPEVEVPSVMPMGEFVQSYTDAAQEQINHIVLDLISAFEGTEREHLTMRERFGYPSRDNVLSVGIIQCNNHTLNGVLHRIITRSPEEAQRILGVHFNEIRNLVSYMGHFSQLTQEQQTVAANRVRDFWRRHPSMMGRVSEAFSTDEGISAQIDDINLRLTHANRLADQYGLTTVYGLAAMLDMSIQRGTSGASRMAAYMADINLEDIDIKTLFDDYFAKNFAHNPELLEAKREYFAGLPHNVIIDLYKLNRMVDRAQVNRINLARTKVIIGHSGLIIDGELQRGARLYNEDRFFGIAIREIMMSDRMSMEGLMQELYQNGYELDQYQVQALHTEHEDMFNFRRPEELMMRPQYIAQTQSPDWDMAINLN